MTCAVPLEVDSPLAGTGVQDPTLLHDPIQFEPPVPVAPPIRKFFHGTLLLLAPSGVPALSELEYGAVQNGGPSSPPIQS